MKEKNNLAHIFLFRSQIAHLTDLKSRIFFIKVFGNVVLIKDLENRKVGEKGGLDSEVRVKRRW